MYSDSRVTRHSSRVWGCHCLKPTLCHWCLLQDVAEAGGQVSPALLQRLILKPQKIQQLAEGIRAIAAQEEPIRRVMQRLEVAEGERGPMSTAGQLTGPVVVSTAQHRGVRCAVHGPLRCGHPANGKGAKGQGPPK